MSAETEQLLKVKGLRDDNDKYELIQNLKEQIQKQEDELMKAEKMNQNFERLVQLVNILGKIDAFLSERTEKVIKKLALLTQHKEEDMYR